MKCKTRVSKQKKHDGRHILNTVDLFALQQQTVLWYLYSFEKVDMGVCQPGKNDL